MKAAFLYNFAKFAEWPADYAAAWRAAFSSVSSVTMPWPMRSRRRSRAGPIEGHELSVRVIAGAAARAQLSPARMWTAATHGGRRSCSKSLKGAPVLSVGDGEKFAELGGVAQLVLEQDRMRFAVNLTAAERARLFI